MNLGSLVDEDITRLERWGLLSPGNDDHKDETEDITGDTASTTLEGLGVTLRPVSGLLHRGTPWFESMVEDSRFGTLRRQRGGYTSIDGNETVQWEVVEVGDDGVELPVEGVGGAGIGKRKRGEGDVDIDVQMRG